MIPDYVTIKDELGCVQKLDRHTGIIKEMFAESWEWDGPIIAVRYHYAGKVYTSWTDACAEARAVLLGDRDDLRKMD